VECSLEANAIKEYVDTNVFEHEYTRIKLLKSAVVYGANAAGKSNLVRAFEFMRNFVLDSAKNLQANERINVESFKLNLRTTKRPSLFEIEFIQDNKIYRYGFQLDKERIWREHLYEIRRTKDVMLFQRLYNQITVSENFTEGKDLENKTRINALFLSVIAQFNGAIASRIVGWFQKVIFLSDMNSNASSSYSVNILSDEKRRVQLLKILRIANLGFENIIVRKFKLTEDHLADMPDEVKKIILSSTNSIPGKVLTIHKKFDHNDEPAGQEEFSFSEEESMGTQKYFALSGYILDALTSGGILVVDELDAGLHPLLTTLIVQFFNSHKDNVSNSQLIFSTNNTNLLSDKVFRRDQVFFVEKDQFGSSRLESLLQKGARNDASFEKEYLNGEYNAVPFSNRERPQLNLFNESDKPSLF
jgi:AAA15 family ATPase/GTPase